MTASLLTEMGFQRKRYDDFIADMEQNARDLFGSDVNLTDNSPLGRFIKVIAFARAEENESTEAVYYSAFIDFAEGASLDYAVKYKGLTRIQAQAASKPAALQINVDPGTTVAAGFIGATTDDIEFVTTADFTDADGDGIILADIAAINTGVDGNVPENTITVINTPTIGVNSITNVLAIDGGRAQETDAELRKRFDDTTGAGTSTTDGIRSALLNTNGVRAAMVVENNDDVADADGRPAHCFEAVVLGGADVDVAETILNNKPAGIRAYGANSVVVNDASGNPQTIGFSFAQEVDIYVDIILTTNSSFPVDGDAQIQNAVVGYIGGVDGSGNVLSGLGMGDDVILFQVEKAIGQIAGVVDVVVSLSTDNVNFVSSNITIDSAEVAQTTVDKVVIS